MQIKRFRARDIKAALKMVKDELGPEAVILSTREMKDRKELGPLVEVTAGAGYQPARAAAAAYGPTTRAALPASPPQPAPGQAPAGPGPSLCALEGGLAEIKELLLDLTHRQGLSERIRGRPALVRLYRELLEAGLDPALARSLVDRIAGDRNGGGGDPRELLGRRLTEMLKVSEPLAAAGGSGPRFVAVVGPAGVGKTTTLAKLAARFGLKQNRKVAIISLDTFRLGAADQLKTYARIMGLPVRVVQDREEFRQAAELFENMDLVLLDTPGRCLTDPDSRRELAEVLAGLEGAAVLLVLSAATKERDLALAIERAGGLPVAGLVISKLDETRAYGNVITNLLKYKKPVSFLTNGQKVPEDIIEATPERLAGLITAGGLAE
ncbi:MAG: flagellar biosynthesis protein FlhF [Thermodesulfobacteriota bacterium]